MNVLPCLSEVKKKTVEHLARGLPLNLAGRPLRDPNNCDFKKMMMVERIENISIFIVHFCS